MKWMTNEDSLVFPFFFYLFGWCSMFTSSFHSHLFICGRNINMSIFIVFYPLSRCASFWDSFSFHTSIHVSKENGNRQLGVDGLRISVITHRDAEHSCVRLAGLRFIITTFPTTAENSIPFDKLLYISSSNECLMGCNGIFDVENEWIFWILINFPFVFALFRHFNFIMLNFFE